ncbi:MAG: DNA-directed RNA polymerase subunit alpha [Candidatus Omnitrophica bacterium]|nr:DNA-directed RNA polymerase subunit alpha [Candidatus Omnitrophota bacterium]MBU1128457.1 DNA-directed RNA polymerase subunit alpha [Candidatus Omnitrophota bacterium]MBU1784053.1 DNA-directed RNA polymerase subunit alpha [Candidatus Omnitrophota bacterium]MBU1851650.1 DNA-directed RNA polymerase subunit alpha [Candidatus Omnitrophota bacterium]
METKLRNFELPKRLVFDEKTYTPTYGRIAAEPFEKGYGITIGNSLRRILLSSIEGTAVTAVKIEGISHEFCAIPGVLEDVPQIIMNIKGLVLRSHFKSPKSMFLSVNKKGEITAKDIETDETVEIINPDHHIATLTEKTDFKIEMVVKRGRGYVAAERNKTGDEAIGMVSVDALFSPVKRVNLDIMDTRVGHITDFDKLVIEIFTNGSMEPKEAVLYAANILQRHLDVFMEIGKLPEEIEEEDEDEKDKESLKKKLNEPISNLELSVRSSNCLSDAKIRTIGDLVRKKETEMLKYKNFGKKSLTEINNILQDRNLHLGMDLSEE